jgi:hypothetical protein
MMTVSLASKTGSEGAVGGSGAGSSDAIGGISGDGLNKITGRANAGVSSAILGSKLSPV